MGQLSDFNQPHVSGLKFGVYSAPKFEDKTFSDALRMAERSIAQAEETNKLAQAQVDESRAWVDLARELSESGADTVADLPEDRQRYWKGKLHKPLRVSLGQ